MGGLYETAKVQELKERIARLRPDSQRLWGKMDPAQALAHCSVTMEWATGQLRPPRMFVGRLLGGFVKRRVLSEREPMRRNAPTSKDLVVAGDRDLATEQERLCGLIDRFSSAGPQGCTTHPHAFFGPLTPDEWAGLMYKHLDHHLRQFGV